jgi:hypothetical protein
MEARVPLCHSQVAHDARARTSEVRARGRLPRISRVHHSDFDGFGGAAEVGRFVLLSLDLVSQHIFCISHREKNMAMTYEEKLAAAASDAEHNDQVVKTVTVDDDGCMVDFVDGTFIIVRNEHNLRRPVVGDTLRLFGRGLGYDVRGIGLLNSSSRPWKLEGLYRYQTAEEKRASHLASVEESNKKKQVEWAEKSGETARRIADLPEPFRARFEWFMRRPEWGWNFGLYELFCCEEAFKIVRGLRGKDQIEAFARMTVSKQKECVPDLVYGEHSGNTFAAACKLAHCYAEKPDLIPKMHGAICPLVGCKTYGCWSTVAQEIDPRDG